MEVHSRSYKERAYGLREKKTFSFIRLSIPIALFLIFSISGMALLKEALQYQDRDGVMDFNYQLYLVGSIGFLAFSFFYLTMIIQYVAHDIQTILYIYPDLNSFRITNKEHKDLLVKFADIESAFIKKIGKEPYYLDGFCFMKLKTGKTIILTSSLIQMLEWDQFLKIGSKKKIINKIIPLLPLRNKQ